MLCKFITKKNTVFLLSVDLWNVHLGLFDGWTSLLVYCTVPSHCCTKRCWDRFLLQVLLFFPVTIHIIPPVSCTHISFICPHCWYYLQVIMAVDSVIHNFCENIRSCVIALYLLWLWLGMEKKRQFYVGILVNWQWSVCQFEVHTNIREVNSWFNT